MTMTETTGTTDGKTGGDKPSNKKTETNRELLMVRLKVISPPIKRLKQQELLMLKCGGDKHTHNEKTETTGTY